jgi:ankyrin repeat protein
VDATGSDGETPLHVAAQDGHEEMAKLLLGRAADLDKATVADGATARLFASKQGHVAVATSLLDRGPSSTREGATTGAARSGRCGEARTSGGHPRATPQGPFLRMDRKAEAKEFTAHAEARSGSDANP